MTTENAQTPSTETPAATDLGTEQAKPETKQESSESSTSTASSASPAATDLGAEEKPKEPAPAEPDLGATPEGEKKDEPAKTPAEERAAAAAAFYGAPEAEADYEFIAPDGMAVDKDLAAEFSPIAKELNLNQAGAQKLIDLKIADNRRTIERWGNHLSDLRTEAKADPEIGGAKYDESLRSARGVLAKFGTPELRKAMNHYGIGAHKEMIRFLSRIGAATGEPKPLGNGDSGVVETKPLHEILYKG